jgi:hypothetical protein
MAQVVHRPAIFDDEERYPFGNVLCKQYPYPESQGESFYDPEDPVKDLFVAGRGFVVGDVSKEVPHGIILSRNAAPRLEWRFRRTNEKSQRRAHF